MASQKLKQHPLTLSLQLALLVSPALANAQQLIATGNEKTAAGTYDTGTQAGRAGTALIAEEVGGKIDGTGVSVITGGSKAHGGYAWDAGEIELTDSAIRTSGTDAYGLFAEQQGQATFTGGSITTSGKNGHAVIANTVAGRNSIVRLKGSELAVSGNATMILAQGVKSRVTATDVKGKVTSGATGLDVPAGIAAQEGGLVQLVKGQFESNAGFALVRSAGTGSLVSTDGTQLTTTHSDSWGAIAVGGGTVALGKATTVSSAGSGVAASGEGSTLTAVDSVIKAADEYGALAEGGGRIETTDGSVAGLTGLSAMAGGTIQTTGTQVEGTGKTDALGSAFGAVAEKDGTLLLGKGTRVSGDNGVGALGGTVRASEATIVASGDPDVLTGFNISGVGLAVSPGAAVALADTAVESAGPGIRFGFDPAQQGAVAKVTMEGGSVASSKRAAVVLTGSGGEGANGELYLSRNATLSGANGQLIEVHGTASRPAQLKVFADSVALAGNLYADSGTVLDLTMTNAASLAGVITGGNALDISADSRWDVKGSSDLNSLRNAGAIAFAAPAQGGYKTVTVNGNYSSDNGSLTLNTSLGDDASPTDRLWVKGSTAGSTTLTVNNSGGSGAQTVEGIPLVRVDGASEGLFALNGRVVGGAYEYQLFKGGVTTPDDGDWYLRSQAVPPPEPAPVDPVDPTNPTDPVTPVSPEPPAPEPGQPTPVPVPVPVPVPTPGPDPAPTQPGQPTPIPTPLFRPEAGAYLANQAASMGLLQHQMHDRMGEPDFARGPDRAPAVWTRIVRRQIDGHAGFGQLDVGSDTSLLQVGGELATWMAGDSRFHFGGMAAAGRADSNVDSALSGYRAKGKVRGYAGGLYATWFGSADTQGGAYADAWLQYGRFDNKVSGDYLAQESYDASSWSASLEGGYTFAMPSGEGFAWFIEPQLQAIYTDYDADRHIEANGTWIGSSLAGQLTTRVGLRVFGNAGGGSYNRVQPFVMLNWWRNDQRNNLSMDGIDVTLGWPRDRYEAKLGAQLQLGGGWTGWGEAAWQTGSDGFRDIGGQIGVNYRW